jgi:hypothetical protein
MELTKKCTQKRFLWRRQQLLRLRLKSYGCHSSGLEAEKQESWGWHCF